MYRVLIADDEDYVRDLLVKNIRSSSLEIEVVAVADDGKAALRSALMLEPDIVVTDIAMPFMNGLELIRELQSAGIHSKYVVISGYDEFEYAKQAISLGVKDYLLKPFLPRELTGVLQKIIEELDSQKTLQQNMSLLKEQAVLRAGLAREKALKELLKSRENCGAAGKECAELGLILSGNFYMAGVVSVTGGSWDFRRQENVEEFLMLLGEGYLPPQIRMYAVSFDGVQLAAVWCTDLVREEEFLCFLRNGLEKITASLEKYYHIQFRCALGRPYENYTDLELSYREAMAVWRGTLTEEKPVQLYGEENGKREEAPNSGQIREWKNQIRHAVRGGQSSEARTLLQGLMKCYASLANKKNDYISVSVGELVYAIQNDLEQAGYDREATEPLSSMQDRINYGSLMDMKAMLETYITKCCQVVAANSEETRAEAVVKEVKLLIEDHLDNAEIDLEWLAARVHFSASYVRQIFKQHTGESVGEYLIRKRMERAGMLLQKTNMRILEIARECGYDNQRYFASSFKKFYGCTPTEFKKAVEEEKLY